MGGKSINNHTNQIANSAYEKHKSDVIDALIKVESASFERAIAYCNIIIVAGYAGAFALLSATKNQISIQTLITVALLLGFSLMVFCIWEIIKMFFYTNKTKKTISIIESNLSGSAFLEKREQIEQEQRRSILSMNKWWHIVLSLTIIPAFTAIACLFYNYILILIS